LIVPKIEENSLQSIKPSQPVDEDLLDDSPAAELAHLPSPESLLNPDIMQPRNSSSSTLHPSDLITQNQLINSWAQRYMRDDPMILPGDPELGLNPSQTKAVAMAMGEKLSLIQGVSLPLEEDRDQIRCTIRLTRLCRDSLLAPANLKRSFPSSHSSNFISASHNRFFSPRQRMFRLIISSHSSFDVVSILCVAASLAKCRLKSKSGQSRSVKSNIHYGFASRRLD